MRTIVEQLACADLGAWAHHGRSSRLVDGLDVTVDDADELLGGRSGLGDDRAGGDVDDIGVRQERGELVGVAGPEQVDLCEGSQRGIGTRALGHSRIVTNAPSLRLPLALVGAKERRSGHP